ncbi:unnamed protein product [Acanthoscelides obtectus]|uniref:BED-type domain-containing protein n=1 Tax=Acanthoscelides obtectus TaxID=200917 RepID=A0A9P0NZZ6_ACAOB|nr:unnamed protein product [Acanthoscelides obtectus]CAK1633913.1 Zinc finger BED domain-containing protein 1 [Acanthoscelides obtectus]
MANRFLHYLHCILQNGEIYPKRQKSNDQKKRWNYFRRSSDKTLAKCNTCGKEYKTTGNTSYLSDHLKRFHPVINTQDREEERIFASGSGSTGSFSRGSSPSTSAQSSQRSVSPFFKQAMLYNDQSSRKKNLDFAVVDMLALDFQPSTINKGFKNLVSLLDPRYDLPSTYTLGGKLLNQRYTDIHNKLKEDISGVDYVALTCNGRTARATESYLTITCHFVSNHQLHAEVLPTKPLTNGVNHTSENIAASIQEIIDEWEIDHNITSIVTDNAASMIKACELLKKKHFPCYAHTLNLVVQDNMKLIQPILKKCKDIVTFIKQSTTTMEIFKKEQNSEKPLKLIQECPIRWNSSYYMIEHILKTNEAIGRTLLKVRKAPQPRSVDDICVLTELVEVLEIFKEATKKISGSKYVTISLVIPVTMGLNNNLKITSTNMETDDGKKFSKGLIDSVIIRLFPYENRTVAKITSLLDPRLKKEGFRIPANACAAINLLDSDMISILKKKTEKNGGSKSKYTRFVIGLSRFKKKY